MRAAWLSVLARFGQEAMVRRDGAWTPERVFLQPLRERDEGVPSGATELGWCDGRRWLCLAAADLREGDGLVWNGLRLRVCSGRAVWMGGGGCYWRGVLALEEVAER